ncbi:MAG: PrsW family intramembrane metalloprotease [Chloroflexi bacterium]|nr:PrsW family intramembrane metalloprotease [Chloroflexota bacterium]
MDAVTLIAYLIAVAVPAFTIYLFALLDVFGTGKTSTILFCAAWGAVGAFSVAWTVNNAVLDRGMTYEALSGGAAPVIEEVLKAAILIYLIRHPRFRYIVDGAVYGIAVGIGFALSENLFIYLPGAGEAVLGTAISRTLSTSLMHATASGLVGISLGRLRRTTSFRRDILPLIGIGLAIGLHAVYNNLAGELRGGMLLIVAIGIGVGGGAFIAWQIGQGLADEKKRFAQTLGLNVNVSAGERQAVQRLGGAGIEQTFGQLDDFFGSGKTPLVRRLLAIQANIGILQNNLSGPASERLREAWEEEITEYRREMAQLRKELGPSVWVFVQSVFPSGDPHLQDTLKDEFARFDPTMVHTFDMFMRFSGLAETFTIEELAERAERLSKIDLFKNISLPNLENLCRAVTAQSFDNGYVLFDEGDEGTVMYLIEDGYIDIFVNEQSGEDKLLRTLEPGKVVGELALLDGEPRSARAQAHGPVRLLALERQVFTMFISSRPQVVIAMLQHLAGKARYTTQAVVTSVEWMARIGQGNYLPQAEVVTLPGQHLYVEPATIDQPAVQLEPAEIGAETPSLIGSTFSKIAELLQQREDSIRLKLMSKGPS